MNESSLQGGTSRRRAIFVSPEHAGDPGWPWLSRVEPMSRYGFDSIFVDNTFRPFPKLTGMYRQWQFARARRAMRGHDVAYIFSTDLCEAMAPASDSPSVRSIYVGFTQDGPWAQEKIDRLGRAMRSYDAVTVFTSEERAVYIDRYGLDASRVHVIPIHTDEANGYGAYGDESPEREPYVLSMGSPNRRFKPVAEACRRLGLPLVIITRPWHELDSLDELRDMGARVIVDANKDRALTYLKHARAAVMTFNNPEIPGGFTTLVHGMFMRTPFILSACLGMSEHVADGENGFVVAHEDGRALESALDRLWNEPGLADRFGARGLAMAEERHSLAAAARRFHELSERLVATRRAA